ncbi:Cyclin PHO80-like [Trypanosoma melophagium]|uniref:Cyclin PHO80-like n=1 Tax=Trypanosoma melophagium TaxID=715481 RepID=UPI003519ECA5|nr:Cyclin PHO80-like [Trypanosoma melophagium]
MASMNASAVDGVSMSRSDPSQQGGDIPVAQSLLTIHALYDLPREMQQLDPRREQLEIVMRPILKYDHRERRVTCIPLEERVVPFSSSAVLFKNGRFVLDLESVTSPNGTAVIPGSPRFRGRLPPEESDDDFDSTNNSSSSGTGGGRNRILLQYPCPRGLTTLLDVLVGIRQRRIGSSFARWVTGNPGIHSVGEGVGYFSVAAEEVHRRKSVTRVVGLGVGGIVCSVAVCGSDEAAVVRERLERDKQRLSTRLPSNTDTNVNINSNSNTVEEVDVDKLLADGASEAEVYRRLLLAADPDHYTRRLQALLTLYSSAPVSAEWAQKTETLLREYAGREEELLRRAAVEVGPECGAVPSRYRLLAYRKKYSLSDKAILACLQNVAGEGMNETLDFEPEVIFASLTAKFGREPRPTSYLFPTQRYTPDKRTFFLDALHFPINRLGENYRNLALAPRHKRLPFTMSPCERPLHMGSSNVRPGKPPGEIEILREKYAPEFAQIVPSIVNALREVVEQNQQLLLQQQHTVDSAFAVFQQQGTHPQLAFQDFVHRAVEYTFISPSSLLAAIIYLDRLCLRHPALIITERNVLRLFLTSLRVASKVVELRSINNRHFANVFGLDTVTVNLLEGVFVKQLQFDVFLSPEEFGEYARVLQPANTPHFRSLPTQHGGIDPRTVVRNGPFSQTIPGTQNHQKSTTDNHINSNNNRNQTLNYNNINSSHINNNNNNNSNCPNMRNNEAPNTLRSTVDSADGEAARIDPRGESQEACDGAGGRQGLSSPNNTTSKKHISGNDGNARNYVTLNNGVTNIVVAPREEIAEARRTNIGTRTQTGCKSKLAV